MGTLYTCGIGRLHNNPVAMFYAQILQSGDQFSCLTDYFPVGYFTVFIAESDPIRFFKASDFIEFCSSLTLDV